MDLSALEALPMPLKDHLIAGSSGFAVSTLLVVVGLILEYWHAVRDRLEERPLEWKSLQNIFGAILVTVGVAGELAVQFCS